ncbi:MAG: C-type lectin domain-containing protein, partial [Deltaproteobacteria bacterium]|nr:C-type lectin domain-containing protein [Deltaproteobacteria bacterium]
SYADARAHCTRMGGHLVVVNSLAELNRLGTLAVERAYPSVWIGATFDTQTWQSDTTCPGLYSWTDGAPVFGVSTTCLATTMRELGEVESVTSLAGMTPTRCNDSATHALCELE